MEARRETATISYVHACIHGCNAKHLHYQRANAMLNGVRKRQQHWRSVLSHISSRPAVGHASNALAYGVSIMGSNALAYGVSKLVWRF